MLEEDSQWLIRWIYVMFIRGMKRVASQLMASFLLIFVFFVALAH